ncbi:COP9 signalosome complex subunit 1 [Wallemia ichthyophaga EXF-994]|uniref:COP9 signalosome complex subunit 1 n=1 Tax=Wallemia ichthyophaga (strain EXF-994 / CBS 113033) TaxID=1299270 RepID=R9AP27_WALI9|nr:COP9 signalosome complex subunit 1 [Wallemia ichthyophaga EXF-994]EOR03770.1 COP9 signalosome complex subunit 1 [Wallemia ichthyophaga EXF-994]
MNASNWIDEYLKNQGAYKIKFILEITSPFFKNVLEWLIDNPINPPHDAQVIGLYNTHYAQNTKQSEHTQHQQTHLNDQLHSTQFQLKSYLNNNLKESIRMSYYSLADIYYSLNNPEHSLNCYLQSRDHISSSPQLIETHNHIINMAIELRNYSLIKNSVIKINSIALNNVDVSHDALLISTAIADLGQSNYAAVVESLTKLSPISTHPLVTPSDISIYLTLCALTTQSRHDIKSAILNNEALRSKFEYAPHTKLLLEQYVSSNYKQLFVTLEENKWWYLLDPHLHHQYTAMVEVIYRRCIVQFFHSYNSITLDSLVEAFGDEQIFTHTLSLIKSAHLNLRYDAVGRVFHRPQLDKRHSLIDRAVTLSELNYKSTAQLLLRIKLSDANLVLGERPAGSHKVNLQRRNSDELDDVDRTEMDVETK